MRKTTKKKMIPLLILRILWRYADQEHMIPMEIICDRLEEEFESEKRMTRTALRKLVSYCVTEQSVLLNCIKKSKKNNFRLKFPKKWKFYGV